MKALLIVFALGWTVWFLLEKQGPAYAHAANFEDAGEELARDFQFGFDLLKNGDVGAAYAFLWYNHYLVMTVIFTLLFSFLIPEVRQAFRRWNSLRGKGAG